jgi:DNA-directed RNA polymerase specialized sigma24 family protein
MKGVELYGRVRYAVQIEGLSQREAARRFGIDLSLASRRMACRITIANEA